MSSLSPLSSGFGMLWIWDDRTGVAPGQGLMIFTTNHPEQLDEVLLRVGWMDRKIHLSYCRPIAIRILEELPRSNRGTSVDTAMLLAEVEITFVDVTKVFTRYDAKGEDMMPR
ncbi:hypothetical protein ZIOFF_045080 [Zingiber officinale]|uniref:ATPase AAA-type core domain-containing protein n=1 Tax=Zingiber officinale TaxID=94328 RepID=A0A8J5FYE3_ZINOF|nr:hypothetical protein ZIOFF_045080 [Zingiber officinale]